MGAFIALSLLRGSGGGGYEDPRPSCQCCGRILVQHSGFQKWLTNSTSGILCMVMVACYIIADVVAWIVAGHWGDIDADRRDTLVRFTLDSWIAAWNLIHKLW